MMFAALPVSYLSKPQYDKYNNAAVDAIDFAAFFESQNPYNLRITTALRANATFPYILPVVRMPSVPEINLMDAGLRDNFGMEVAVRYLYTMKDWIARNNKQVVLLQIRDTREHELFPQSPIDNLASMITTPLFVIQNKWESFQSYGQSYLKDYALGLFDKKLDIITMEYVPEHPEKSAALNFHLTRREKKDLLNSIYNPVNQSAALQMKSHLSN
jgi:hypothetical protein